MCYSKSILSIEELQKIINENAGTGRIIRDRHGNWQHKEKIILNKIIGVYINGSGDIEESTNAFIIHYSKKSVHAVPARKEKIDV